MDKFVCKVLCFEALEDLSLMALLLWQSASVQSRISPGRKCTLCFPFGQRLKFKKGSLYQPFVGGVIHGSSYCVVFMGVMD